MLDDYENKIEHDLELGEFKELSKDDELFSIAKVAAKNYLKKTERINIRISPHDLEYIKAAAVEEGLPYQTLVSSVLHKFVRKRFNIDNHPG